ncbi:Toxin CcdB [Roseibaca ekhonensis]|jgi:toxin CcdB|uniref:Toxin CcdB n=1 Tax=Roseinatronobacter ekhonensis TaxID=254356 RepID=A0A3B0MCD9_9RHOB|nr:CcdB family protein [Roseibaca ekhonensis]SUZ33501.1 Toxin CcdB [Roseibaca ekhonensis]
MARFSLHDLPGGGRVVNLQSDFLDWADTRVVAPLVPVEQGPPPAKHLNPMITLDDGQFVLIVQSMAAVRASALGPAVGDLSDHHDAITRAVDMVFQGF